MSVSVRRPAHSRVFIVFMQRTLIASARKSAVESFPIAKWNEATYRSYSAQRMTPAMIRASAAKVTA